MKRNFIFSFFILGLIALITGGTVFAQQRQGLNVTVSPTALEVTDEPGKTIQGKFRLRNNSSEPLSLKLHVDKLNANEEGQVIPATAQKEDTYLSWLQFESDTVEALPQEWTDISYKLTIPADAAFGYYYAIRVSQTNSTVAESDTTVLGEVVIPLLLNVKKDGARREAKITEFKTTQLVNEYLPIEFVTTVENKGNVHLKPRGNIFIRGAGEKDLGILEVNPGMGTVLPGKKRSFSSAWNEGFLVREEVVEDGQVKLDSNGKPVTRLTFNWNKLTDFRIGQYTANLLLVYDNGQRDVALEGSTTFWVLPYTALGVALLILIVLFIIIRFFLKQYVKGQVKKYQKKG